MGNSLPNNQRQRRRCYALFHILFPVSAAHMSIFQMDSNSNSTQEFQDHPHQFLTKTHHDRRLSWPIANDSDRSISALENGLRSSTTLRACLYHSLASRAVQQRDEWRSAGTHRGVGGLVDCWITVDQS